MSVPQSVHTSTSTKGGFLFGGISKLESEIEKIDTQIQ